MTFNSPPKDCAQCSRLVSFRLENQEKFAGKWNAPVPSFGDLDAKLLIVGLAPGLKGANFSGRPFTGDYAGDLLYPTLLKFGFAKGQYEARADDGLELVNTRITNAVRCVPPENKPTTDEINTCRNYLADEIVSMPNLKVILSLGLVSHKAVVKVFGARQASHPFAHGAEHKLLKPSSPEFAKRIVRGSIATKMDPPVKPEDDNPITLIDSYHCSRYNTSTGRLTTPMFEDVFSKINI